MKTKALVDFHICISVPLNGGSYCRWGKGWYKSAKQNVFYADRDQQNTEFFKPYEAYITDNTKGIILTTEVYSTAKMKFGIPKTVFTTSITL